MCVCIYIYIYTDYSQVDNQGLWYKSDLGARKSRSAEGLIRSRCRATRCRCTGSRTIQKSTFWLCGLNPSTLA